MNVGLVLVSHSPALARGLAELAAQMGVGTVPVLPAGGDVDGGLGTSIDLVERAVREADQGAGVVLLADIGSSVMTAKTYVEDLEEESGGGDSPGGRVVFADAPFVEGAVAAAAAAAAGADVDAVVAAARDAYAHRKT